MMVRKEGAFGLVARFVRGLGAFGSVTDFLAVRVLAGDDSESDFFLGMIMSP